ncbi:helix-turn-helix domain-containing protein [Bosea sp. (in: a-proteobacteria)]|uniref:helix-turn-helix domain-containing protein n=1 Tax=Bosea sp. (in: a-proteobacteria) TaxID=1871050 RepID=UPI003A5CE4BE
MRWRRIDLQKVIRERFGVDYHERTIGKLLQQVGFSPSNARPHHPAQDAASSKRSNKPGGHVEGPARPSSQGKPIDIDYETEPASARTTTSSGSTSDAEPVCLTQRRRKS